VRMGGADAGEGAGKCTRIPGGEFPIAGGVNSLKWQAGAPIGEGPGPHRACRTAFSVGTSGL